MKRVFALLTMMVALSFAACEHLPVDTNEPLDSLFTFVGDDVKLSLEVASDGGSYTYNFTTNVAWEATASEEWLSVTPESGTAKNDNLTITVTKNEDSTSRTASVTIIYGGSQGKAITVTQSAAQPEDGDNGSGDKEDDSTDDGADDGADDGVDDGTDDGTDDGVDDGMGDVTGEIEMMFPENTQIWYKTTDDKEYTFSVSQPFDANILTNSLGACANGQCYPFYAIGFDAAVTTVNQAAFSNSNLEIVYLPHSIKTIGQAAFLGSSSLETVHIGAGIENIVMGAFTNCGNLSELYIRATTPPSLGEYALMRNSSDGSTYVYLGTTIYVPAEAVSAYKSHIAWSKYADYIVGYDFIKGKEAVGGGDDDSTTTSPFSHRLLIVEHTGVNCSYCPEAAERLYALANSKYASYYSEVTVHGGDMAPSDEDPAYSEAARTLHKFYKVTGVPAIYLNFAGGLIPRGDTDDYFVNTTMSSIFNANRRKTGADVGIAIDVKAQASTLSIDIDVKSAKAQEYFVAAWVLENNISSPSQNGATSWIHTTYNHALRYIANTHSTTYMAGDSLGVIAVDGVKEKSYSVPISSNWSTNNLEVLVIVSSAKGSGYEVVNTAVCPVNSVKDYEYR